MRRSMGPESVVRAIEEGYPQREIANAAYQFQRQVDSKQRSIVGVNKYVDDAAKDKIPLLKIDHAVESAQVDHVKRTQLLAGNGKAAEQSPSSLSDWLVVTAPADAVAGDPT